MPLALECQAQTAIAHREVPAGRRHSDAAERRGQRRSVVRIGDTSVDLPVEPLRKRRPERLVDMQDDEDRKLERRRQAAQNLNDGAGSAGGCPDGDEIVF